VNSYGAGTSTGGSTKGRKLPDFIVVKATGEQHADKIVLVIELKTAKANVGKARHQLSGYLRFAIEKPNTLSPLHGILIRQSKLDIYSISRGSNRVEKVLEGQWVLEELPGFLIRIANDARNIG